MLRNSLFSLLLFGCSFAFAACANGEDIVLEDMPVSEADMERTLADGIDTLTIAHWNIGHFALGKSSNTTIGSDNSESRASMYRELLDSVDADIIGICEYNPTFSVNGEKTSSILFSAYPYNYIGAKYSYNCNAIFSRYELDNKKAIMYENGVQRRYYIESNIRINDYEVIFVETHLDWNQGAEGKDCRAAQICRLTDEFSKYPYVIICADFNVSDINEFRPFIDAGFSLANGEGRGFNNTYPADNPLRAIDNVIVKGFDVINFSVVSHSELSDHCLVNCRILFNNSSY